MTAGLIGTLLDDALSYPRFRHPESALQYLQSLGKIPVGEGVTEQAAARLALVNHLRRSRQPPKEIDFDDDDEGLDDYEIEDIPTYRELARSIIVSKLPAPLKQFEETARPDLIIRDEQGRPQAVLEIGYGFAPISALAAVDRLLHFAWASYGAGYAKSPVRMVGYLVVHELSSGDVVRDVEGSINEWIGENYGPFKSLDRIFIPMSPRLTRTASLSSHGLRISAINPLDRPTGYVAFCISCDRAEF